MSADPSSVSNHWLLGRLTWDSIPMTHEPILLWTFVAVVLGGLGVLALLTKFRLWGPLWRDWFCSIDHKKIGIMYMVLGLVMLLRGFADALMMRLQQAILALGVSFAGGGTVMRVLHDGQLILRPTHLSFARMCWPC